MLEKGQDDFKQVVLNRSSLWLPGDIWQYLGAKYLGHLETFLVVTAGEGDRFYGHLMGRGSTPYLVQYSPQNRITWLKMSTLMRLRNTTLEYERTGQNESSASTTLREVKYWEATLEWPTPGRDRQIPGNHCHHDCWLQNHTLLPRSSSPRRQVGCPSLSLATIISWLLTRTIWLLSTPGVPLGACRKTEVRRVCPHFPFVFWIFLWSNELA